MQAIKEVERSEALIRSLIEMVTENLAIARASIVAHEQLLKSQDRIETTNSRMDMGIYSLIKKTDIIIGLTQRLQVYKSGNYLQLLLDEWTVFFTFFFLHPFVPKTMELFGSIMLYVLTGHRLWICRSAWYKTTITSFYFTSPYKAIFLLYWFVNEYVAHPMTPIVPNLSITLPPPYRAPSKHLTVILISFAHWNAMCLYAVVSALIESVQILGFAQQLNKYLLLETQVMIMVLSGFYYVLSIALAGIFSSAYMRVCGFEIPMPFGGPLKPFYYVCNS